MGSRNCWRTEQDEVVTLVHGTGITFSELDGRHAKSFGALNEVLLRMGSGNPRWNEPGVRWGGDGESPKI